MFTSSPEPFVVSLCSAPMRDNQLGHQMAVMQAFLEASQRSQLLCFGESFLQGFEGLTWDYATDRERAIRVNSSQMEAIRDLTRRFRRGLSFGFIELFEDMLYSSNIVLDSEGNTVDLFRRVSLGWKEHSITGPEYREGPGFHGFELQGARTVTAICGDLWYTENLAAIKALEPQVLLWPLYVDYAAWDWEGETRAEYAEQAAELGCPVLMINSLVDDPQRAKGGAVVFNGGGVLAELPMGQTGMLSFDLHALIADPLSCRFEHQLLDLSQLS